MLSLSQKETNVSHIFSDLEMVTTNCKQKVSKTKLFTFKIVLKGKEGDAKIVAFRVGFLSLKL